MPEFADVVLEFHRLRGELLRDYERGYWIYLDGRPMIACRDNMERVGWCAAQADARASTSLILP